MGFLYSELLQSAVPKHHDAWNLKIEEYIFWSFWTLYFDTLNISPRVLLDISEFDLKWGFVLKAFCAIDRSAAIVI